MNTARPFMDGKSMNTTLPATRELRKLALGALVALQCANCTSAQTPAPPPDLAPATQSAAVEIPPKTAPAHQSIPGETSFASARTLGGEAPASVAMQRPPLPP